MGNFSVGKGAAYIYIELIVMAFSGYILWLLLSKITTPDVIGTASTVISIAAIFAAVVSLGIPNGIPRYLGKAFSEQKLEDAKIFVSASVLLTGISILVASVIIFLTKDLWILNNLEPSLVILCILLMGATSTITLFRYIVISSLNTRLLVSRQIISAAIRIVLSVFLILFGLEALGLTIAYTTSQIVGTILIGFAIARILRSSKNTVPAFSFMQSCKSIVAAGFPSWLPATITTVGSQAGTIFVFAASGSSQAGTYFIAFSIFSAIFLVTSSLMSAAFPALSAMKDGRKRFTWRIVKISLIVSLPLSCSLIFYSEEILALLSEDYTQEATTLQILLLSILPLAIMTSINTLVYSYGNYRQVLEIGIALSIPRAILYFIFVPFYGGMGAAVSFSFGTIAGLMMSISIAQTVGLKIFWKDLAIMLGTCISIGFSVSYFGINYIGGIPITLLMSYLILLKLRILTREDIQDTLGVLPYRISHPTIKAVNVIGKKLNRNY